MEDKHIYVRVTRKILEYYPDWRAIVDKVGEIIKKGESSSTVRIFTNLQIKELDFTIPNDCLEHIDEGEALLEKLRLELDG